MLEHGDEDYPPLPDQYLEADSFADSIAIDVEIAAMQEAEDRHVVWLCDNGREDEAVDGGMPAWFYKALYLDEP
jgi:hypothetical protein